MCLNMIWKFRPLAWYFWKWWYSKYLGWIFVWISVNSIGNGMTLTSHATRENCQLLSLNCICSFCSTYEASVVFWSPTTIKFLFPSFSVNVSFRPHIYKGLISLLTFTMKPLPQSHLIILLESCCVFPGCVIGVSIKYILTEYN